MISSEKLKSFRIFQDTSAGALQRLAEAMEEVVHKKGATILNQGQETSSLYLVAKGRVGIRKNLDKEGVKFKTVAHLKSEEFFGEMSFLEKRPHSASVVAEEDTTLFVLPRQSLDELFKKDARFALEQMMALFTGVSSRLRSTTDELVTVFEIARAVGTTLSMGDLIARVLNRLSLELGESISIGFYLWNPYNDEYEMVNTVPGPSQLFPKIIDLQSPVLQNLTGTSLNLEDMAGCQEKVAPFALKKGHIILSRSDMSGGREGLFVYISQKPSYFDSGQSHMVETVSAVLAPALVTVRRLEEEHARVRLEQSRQQGYSL